MLFLVTRRCGVAPEPAMLRSLRVGHFKSLVELDLQLGRVNVFIGANGSGKSNLLEALGVLSAAAFGRVDDETLLRRGVRPGVPRLYKTAFPSLPWLPHIYFGATTAAGASFDVTVWNPIANPGPAWRYKTETLRGNDTDEPVATRGVRGPRDLNQEQGLAALKIVELPAGDPARGLVDALRDYAVYSANTPTLRGLVHDQQTREPVGLAGGRLPEATGELLGAARGDEWLSEALDAARSLIDWARGFSAAPSVGAPLSPSAARSRSVIKFRDRFMAEGRNILTGYDASEGALHILFCAVLALHPRAPRLLAVDNVDQSINPRLAAALMERLCSWTAGRNGDRQWLLTAHNPAVLDGLPLDQPDVRLFVVDRDSDGHTMVRHIDLAAAVEARPSEEWTLSRMWMNGYLGGVPDV
jgi:energy-coupling factor transporter ATP-binding protein EcfA2